MTRKKCESECVCFARVPILFYTRSTLVWGHRPHCARHKRLHELGVVPQHDKGERGQQLLLKEFDQDVVVIRKTVIRLQVSDRAPLRRPTLLVRRWPSHLRSNCARCSALRCGNHLSVLIFKLACSSCEGPQSSTKRHGEYSSTTPAAGDALHAVAEAVAAATAATAAAAASAAAARQS